MWVAFSKIVLYDEGRRRTADFQLQNSPLADVQSNIYPLMYGIENHLCYIWSLFDKPSKHNREPRNNMSYA